MREIPIGLELYSVRNSLAKDMPGTLHKIKEYGYETVEYFMPLDYNCSCEMKRVLDNENLPFSSWHLGIDNLYEDKNDETIEIANNVVCKNIIIPAIGHEYYESFDKLIEILGKMNLMSKKLNDNGIRLGYHNHAEEFKTFKDGKTIWTLMCENTDENIIMQYDTGNALSGNADISKELLTLKGRAGIAHIKPYSLKDKFEVLIGDDDVDYNQIFNFLKGDGGCFSYIVEYEGISKYDEMEAVKLCLDNLVTKYGSVL